MGILINDCISALKNIGFIAQEHSATGALYCCYEKCLRIKNGRYMYFAVDLIDMKIAYLIEDCVSSPIKDDVFDIPADIVDNSDDFVKWLDTIATEIANQ